MTAGDRVIHLLCEVENFYSAQGELSYHVPGSVCGKAPTRQLHSKPIAASGSGHTGKFSTSFEAVIHICKRLTNVLRRMQLALRATCRKPHGASRSMLAMSAWSVKTRRAPSRHCRDARVYDHTTSAVHDIEYTPSTPPPPSGTLISCPGLTTYPPPLPVPRLPSPRDRSCVTFLAPMVAAGVF